MAGRSSHVEEDHPTARSPMAERLVRPCGRSFRQPVVGRGKIPKKRARDIGSGSAPRRKKIRQAGCAKGRPRGPRIARLPSRTEDEAHREQHRARTSSTREHRASQLNTFTPWATAISIVEVHEEDLGPGRHAHGNMWAPRRSSKRNANAENAEYHRAVAERVFLAKVGSDGRNDPEERRMRT